MATTQRTEHIIVMGVSGAGKTTLARGIAAHTGWTFAEGDRFHPAANVAKMRSGTPLIDADRWPWLRAIGTWIDERRAEGESTVVACSALRRRYRDLLREGRPGVRFCHVRADRALIAVRLVARRGHYMPPSLLPSQLATLEPLDPDEPGVEVWATGTPEEMVAEAITALSLQVPQVQR